MAGWGSKGEGKGQPSQLYKVDVRVWSNKQCANTYNNRIPGRIEDNMLCAADNGRDSCSVSTLSSETQSFRFLSSLIQLYKYGVHTSGLKSRFY